MFGVLKNYLFDLRDRQRMNLAISKGAAMRQARKVDLTLPTTWEFSGFSQNGEDGVLDVFRSQLLSSNRYFVEIGSADGMENNSSWLVLAEQYNGLMIEGSPALVERVNRLVVRHSIGVECKNMFLTQENARDLPALAMHQDPDVFSLDIDGNDYYVLQKLLENGLRPKIIVVEYNSVYGPERSMTIEYTRDFYFKTAHPTELYYGVSIAGWRKILGNYGYRFVTVEKNGVNGFFVDPAFFDSAFLDGVQGCQFAENRYQLTKFRKPSEEQFELIADQKFFSI